MVMKKITTQQQEIEPNILGEIEDIAVGIKKMATDIMACEIPELIVHQALRVIGISERLMTMVTAKNVTARKLGNAKKELEIIANSILNFKELFGAEIPSSVEDNAASMLVIAGRIAEIEVGVEDKSQKKPEVIK